MGPRERLTARFARGAERKRWQERGPAAGRPPGAVAGAGGGGRRCRRGHPGGCPRCVDAAAGTPGRAGPLRAAADRSRARAGRLMGATGRPARRALPAGRRAAVPAPGRRPRRHPPGRLRDPGLARRDRRDQVRQREADTPDQHGAGDAPSLDRSPNPAGTALRGPAPAGRTPTRARSSERRDAVAPDVDATAGGEAAYQVRRTTDYPTTGAWTVLVNGETVGSVRPVFGATGRPKAWQARYGIWPAGVRDTYPTRDAAAVQVLAERQRRRDAAPAAGRRSSTKR